MLSLQKLKTIISLSILHRDFKLSSRTINMQNVLVCRSVLHLFAMKTEMGNWNIACGFGNCSDAYEWG